MHGSEYFSTQNLHAVIITLWCRCDSYCVIHQIEVHVWGMASTLDEPSNGWQYILSAVEVSHPFVVNAERETSHV